MIIFRADGNEKIGAGHIMRCLSLAEAFKTYDEDIVFYTSTGDFSSTIIQAGMKNVILHSEYMELDKELGDFKKKINGHHPSFVIVDSYYVTRRYLEELYMSCHKYGGKLIYIDDMLSFAYPCDYLINSAVFALDKEWNYKEIYKKAGINEGDSGYPEFLLGSEYILLRKEFLNLNRRLVKEKGNNILISTGGADSEHIALQLVKEIISNNRSSKYCFHIVVGAMNGDRDEIENISNKCTYIKTYHRISNMSLLMQKCDVAISAAGSTLYELCATQTPTITYILAENQKEGAEFFESKGIMKCAGDIRILEKEELAKKLIEEAGCLCDNAKLRKEIAIKQKEMNIGDGQTRIVERLYRAWH